MTYEFAFPIKPMAKQSTRFGGKKAYQPADVVNYHTYIRLMAREAMMRNQWHILGCPLSVEITAVFTAPKSMKRADRERIALGHNIHKTTKPDLDNLAKATLDPLNGLVWADDALITDLSVSKRWGVADELRIVVNY